MKPIIIYSDSQAKAETSLQAEHSTKEINNLLAAYKATPLADLSSMEDLRRLIFDPSTFIGERVAEHLKLPLKPDFVLQAVSDEQYNTLLQVARSTDQSAATTALNVGTFKNMKITTDPGKLAELLACYDVKAKTEKEIAVYHQIAAIAAAVKELSAIGCHVPTLMRWPLVELFRLNDAGFDINRPNFNKMAG